MHAVRPVEDSPVRRSVCKVSHAAVNIWTGAGLLIPTKVVSVPRTHSHDAVEVLDVCCLGIAVADPDADLELSLSHRPSCVRALGLYGVEGVDTLPREAEEHYIPRRAGRRRLGSQRDEVAIVRGEIREVAKRQLRHTCCLADDVSDAMQCSCQIFDRAVQ